MLAMCEIRAVFSEWQVVEECPRKTEIVILFQGISLSFGQFSYSLIDLYMYIEGGGRFLLERISVYKVANLN